MNNLEDMFLNELSNDKPDEQPLHEIEDDTSSQHANTIKQSPIEDLTYQTPLFNTQKESDMDSLDSRRILNPETPRETAQIFINDQYRSIGIRSIQCVTANRQFYEYHNGFYRTIDDLKVQADIARFLNASFKVKKDKSLGIEKDLIVPFNTNSSKEKEVMNALKCIASEGIDEDPAIKPTWIFNLNPDLDDPNQIIPFKNKLLSIQSFLKEGDPHSCLNELTPKFFNCSQIPFNIDPQHHGTLRPVKFIQFLENIFDEDFDDANNRQSITFLQQWFGYCLTNMTWAQKILLIVGPPRSGKGTIANVMQTMLGEANFTNPSAASLTERFPLESWINKRLVIFGDARFGDKKDTVKEILLQVSGGDRVNVDRKNKSILSGVVLPAKIMILSNSLPKFRDEGAAFSSRFLTLKLEKTFIGKEDKDLFERDLKPEIPLIFWWALDGLRDLMAKGSFVQPESGKDSIAKMKSYESPVKDFADQKCVLDKSEWIPKKTLFNLYEVWCKENEIRTLEYNTFCDHVTSVCPAVKVRKMGTDPNRVPCFSGICHKDRSLTKS